MPAGHLEQVPRFHSHHSGRHDLNISIEILGEPVSYFHPGRQPMRHSTYTQSASASITSFRTSLPAQIITRHRRPNSTIGKFTDRRLTSSKAIRRFIHLILATIVSRRGRRRERLGLCLRFSAFGYGKVANFTITPSCCRALVWAKRRAPYSCNNNYARRWRFLFRVGRNICRKGRQERAQ